MDKFSSVARNDPKFEEDLKKLCSDNLGIIDKEIPDDSFLLKEATKIMKKLKKKSNGNSNDNTHDFKLWRTLFLVKTVWERAIDIGGFGSLITMIFTEKEYSCA